MGDDLRLRFVNRFCSRTSARIIMPYTPAKIRAGGELFKFQWTWYSRVQQNPWKWQYKHVPYFRFYWGGVLALFPIFCYVQKIVNSPANVENWRKIRASKEHTFFDLPHD